MNECLKCKASDSKAQSILYRERELCVIGMMEVAVVASNSSTSSSSSSIAAHSTRYSQSIANYGQEHFDVIQRSRVLVVGAGGIGCEILKNLALIGFQHIELIDLDTIDVSNLNRQFLFRPEHVGKPKALVAAEAVKRFNSDVNIVAYHGNIKESRFGTKFIAQFDVVLNALDNVDARKHVNRLCLSTSVPLIDAGTTGYLGQVMPIYKGVTACYECVPKPTQKVYPICTIRSTPDKPVHCIVWAKEFLKLCFGIYQDSMLFEDPKSGEMSVYMQFFPPSFDSAPSSDDITPELAYARDVIKAIFVAEIQKRIEMNTYKTAKKMPEPLDIAMADRVARELHMNKTKAVNRTAGWDRSAFSIEEGVSELMLCFVYYLTQQRESIGSISFDKDDDMAMRFVSAAANLRCRIFHIPAQSYYDAKGIAGNIIPAIATTNAIVAGIQVIYAVHLLKPGMGKEDRVRACKHTYCLRAATRRGLYIQPTDPEQPRAECFVCQTAQITLQLDPATTTLGEVLTKVLKGKLGFNEPTVIHQQTGSIIYEEGEDADEDLKDNLSLILADCPGGGIADGTVLSVEDFTQDLTVIAIISAVPREVFENAVNEMIAADLFAIGSEAIQTKPGFELSSSSATAPATTANATAELAEASSNSTGKRKRSDDSFGGDGDAIQGDCNDEQEPVLKRC